MPDKFITNPWNFNQVVKNLSYNSDDPRFNSKIDKIIKIVITNYQDFFSMWWVIANALVLLILTSVSICDWSNRYEFFVRIESNGHFTFEGTWSSWNAWSECSSTCGSGSSFRTKTCKYMNIVFLSNLQKFETTFLKKNNPHLTFRYTLMGYNLMRYTL